MNSITTALASIVYRTSNKVSSIFARVKRSWNQFLCEGQLKASKVDYDSVSFYGRPIMRFSPQSNVRLGKNVVIRSGCEQNGVIGNRFCSVIKVGRGGVLAH